MQKTFFIRLGATPEAGVSWLVRGEGESTTPASGELREVALRAQGAKVVVLAPAGVMVSAEAQLPALPAARLRQALPYALEEQFAEEVERLHFAIGKRDAAGHYPVVALERERMTQWQGLFSEVELRPHVMLNEALTLPWHEGEWSLLLQDEEALLRNAPQQGYAIPMSELDEWLALAWQGLEEPPSALRLFDGRSAAQRGAWQGAPVGAELIEERIDSVLALLSQTEPAAGINLLQGDFSRKEQLGRLWRPWRATAALLAAWVVLQGAMSVGSYLRLSAEEERLYAAVEQVYRETFPEARNVVNPQVQMERKLAELKGGGGAGAFAVLLASSGPVLQSIDGLQLRNLRYKQDELELELELKDLPSLDRLKEALQQQPLVVDIRGASTRNDRVESRIALREAGV
jgi:general secretion pathway protein L